MFLDQSDSYIYLIVLEPKDFWAGFSRMFLFCVFNFNVKAILIPNF